MSYRCAGITDRGVLLLAGGLHHLVELSLFGCIKLTDQSVAALINENPSLKYLNLYVFTGMVADCLALHLIFSTDRG